MSTETAEVIVCTSVDAQSIDAARAYPELKILCLRCSASVIGSEFEAHLQGHLQASTPAPGHWEAL